LTHVLQVMCDVSQRLKHDAKFLLSQTQASVRERRKIMLLGVPVAEIPSDAARARKPEVRSDDANALEIAAILQRPVWRGMAGCHT
jgi:hypothetical protein